MANYSLQGKNQDVVTNALSSKTTKGITSVKKTCSAEKVFVVYGHDNPVRSELEAMLRRWGLDPIILDQLPSEGATLIEKLERYYTNVGFAVVLGNTRR